MSSDLSNGEVYVDAGTLRAVYALQLNTCTSVVSLAILAYDYLLTLDLEIKYIWHAHWSIVKWLYLLTRYLPFIEAVVVLTRILAPGLDAETCHILMVSNCWMYTVGMGMSEVVLMIRTWAVWERRRSIGVGLIIYLFVLTTPTWWATLRFSRSITYALPPTPSIVGCMTIHNNALVAIDWVLLMVMELGVLMLMVIKAVKNYKKNPGLTLYKVILRDGIAYYINLWALSIINLLIIATQPPDLYLLFVAPVRVIHSLLTARIVLRIREFGDRSQVSPDGGLETGRTTGRISPTPSLIFAPVSGQQSWVDGDPRDWQADEVEMDVTRWWHEERERRNAKGAGGVSDSGGSLHVRSPDWRKSRDRSLRHEQVLLEMCEEETHTDDGEETM
ncbi:hypothetical protein BV22DRAFT_1100573 [Leucogyrophana mollusca]|uniref:Uncharacterized protein n=1 Tax=Leucogyrophana mollusca TaxID=85980 RepID=A0ACB8AXK6_9AGAM|nr:hypothetical protein BV22DRAFT_1100573 [Leucogyrophana mollusca]